MMKMMTRMKIKKDLMVSNISQMIVSLKASLPIESSYQKSQDNIKIQDLYNFTKCLASLFTF